LTVLPEGHNIEGYGSILNGGANSSVLKWFDIGYNAVNSELLYSGFRENETRTNPVIFKVILALNQTERVIDIPLREIGTFNTIVICHLDGIGSGNYNLTVSLVVEGSDRVDDIKNIWIEIQ